MNGPDFAHEDSPPERAYLVLTIERTGSKLLCDALRRTGLAGLPHEWFGYTDLHDQADAAGVAASRSRRDAPQLTSLAAYVEEIAARTSVGGVFGSKVHRYQFLQLKHDGLADSPLDLLPVCLREDARIVLLTRGDHRRQAVSTLLARQTGIYGVLEGTTGERQLPPTSALAGTAEEVIDSLNRIVSEIVEHERQWEEWCTTCGLRTMRLSYESLCDDYRGAVVRVVDHVTGTQIERSAVPAARFRVQRGDDNERLLRLWPDAA